MGFGSGGGGFTPSPNNVPGSTKTGTDKDTDVHEFTGSVDITGSLTLNGSAITGGGGGGGSPGGSNSQVQYNDGGAFGGASSLVYDDVNNHVGIGVTDPDVILEVLDTSTQQKWSYDADSFATLTVADGGDTTLSSSEGGNITLDADDILLQSNGGQVKIDRPGGSTRLQFDVSTSTSLIDNPNNNDIAFRLGTGLKELARLDQSENALLMSGTFNNPGGDAAINFRDTATSIHSPGSNRLAITAPTLEVTGTLSVEADTDATAIVGRANVGAVPGGTSDYAYFSHIDQAGVNTYALEQRANGTTSVNAPSGGKLYFRLGNVSTAMLIDGSNNNNVGINGTPSARLHVQANTPEKDIFRCDGDTDNILFVSGSGKVGIGTGTPTAALHVSSSTSDPLFRVDHSTQAGSQPILYVTGSGLVGIGTDAPRTDAVDTNRLHILGESGADQGQDPVDNTLLMLENNDHVGVQFMTPIDKSGFLVWGDADAARVAHFYFLHNDNRFHFDSAPYGTEAMTIRASGDSVNMGENNSAHMLTAKAALHISSSTGGTDVGGPVLLRVDHADQPGAQPTLFVTGSGRVGIGTDTPVQELSVSGSAAFSGAFGSTAIETLTANGTISANTGLTLIDASSSLAVDNTLLFSIADGTFAGQEKKIRGLIISGSDGANSTGIYIFGSNIDSPPFLGGSGQIVLSSSNPAAGPSFQRAGCSLVWDGSKWLPVGNYNFNINTTGF
jgi:hypothetical protein